MTIVSPALSLPTRVVVAGGRAAERLTEVGLEVVDATLVARVGADVFAMPVKFHAKPGGYYAMQLDPSRDYPSFPEGSTVTLEVTMTLADGTVETRSADVPAADLAPTARTQELAGQDFRVIDLPGAPVTIDVRRDPSAVMLEGLVLTNGNPASPGAGLDVTVGGTGPFTTDADGRFRTGPLPLTTSVAVSITDGDDTTNSTYNLDFSAALNRATFSFQPETD